MQSCKRPLARIPNAITKRAKHTYRPITPIPIRTMSIFPRSIYTDQGFAPLFRLLEDFDSYQTGQGRQAGRGQLPTFQPKFDVRETDAAYELHGELPGMNKKDVSIEFSEPQTLVIRGRVERSYTEGTPPAGAIEGQKSGGAITEGGEEKRPRKATVEDEGAETTAVESHKKSKDAAKYWVSERSVGEFARTFNFPTHVNQDAVSASLKEGILSVVVPKLKKTEGRRITVE
jgi:HSP20 family molecular chaperone IbpA